MLDLEVVFIMQVVQMCSCLIDVCFKTLMANTCATQCIFVYSTLWKLNILQFHLPPLFKARGVLKIRQIATKAALSTVRCA